MIAHFCKLVWNRKRTNIPVIVEVFLSFLVLVAAVMPGVYYTDNYRRPLGFTYENVWYISMSSGRRSSYNDMNARIKEDSTAVKQVYTALRDFEEIEAVAGTYSTLFGGGFGAAGVTYNGRPMTIFFGQVTDEFKDVLGLQIAHGRWFEKADDAMSWEPVVVTQQLGRELFGSEDPLGKKILQGFSTGLVEKRVVGVVSNYRTNPFAPPEHLMFTRFSWERPVRESYLLPTKFLIKIRPGTTAAFEEKLMAKLQTIAREWTFEIETLSQMRESLLKGLVTLPIMLGIIGAFLMLMVGLGLVGILWQSVIQRTKEIGLRRANGATAKKIYMQILGELLVITSIGVAIGAAIVIQFPILEAIGFGASKKAYIYGLGISFVLLYGLVILCGLYPSWLATRIHPAEALHYE